MVPFTDSSQSLNGGANMFGANLAGARMVSDRLKFNFVPKCDVQKVRCSDIQCLECLPLD